MRASHREGWKSGEHDGDIESLSGDGELFSWSLAGQRYVYCCAACGKSAVSRNVLELCRPYPERRQKGNLPDMARGG